jgi:hypothetical protein
VIYSSLLSWERVELSNLPRRSLTRVYVIKSERLVRLLHESKNLLRQLTKECHLSMKITLWNSPGWLNAMALMKYSSLHSLEARQEVIEGPDSEESLVTGLNGRQC